jgi:uncharacterized protein (TIGR02301 family)
MKRIMSGFGTGTVVSAIVALLLALAPLPAKADSIDDGLTRLSEILGSIHHLRDVCGANDGPLWRNKMIDMINIANLDAEKRQQMISHFNDAYYDARTRYPMCTRDAAKRANTLFDEAHTLASRLSDGRRNAASLF